MSIKGQILSAFFLMVAEDLRDVARTVSGLPEVCAGLCFFHFPAVGQSNFLVGRALPQAVRQIAGKISADKSGQLGLFYLIANHL
jgi:hypothetical protein